MAKLRNTGKLISRSQSKYTPVGSGSGIYKKAGGGTSQPQSTDQKVGLYLEITDNPASQGTVLVRDSGGGFKPAVDYSGSTPATYKADYQKIISAPKQAAQPSNISGKGLYLKAEDTGLSQEIYTAPSGGGIIKPTNLSLGMSDLKRIETGQFTPNRNTISEVGERLRKNPIYQNKRQENYQKFLQDQINKREKFNKNLERYTNPSGGAFYDLPYKKQFSSLLPIAGYGFSGFTQDVVVLAPTMAYGRARGYLTKEQKEEYALLGNKQYLKETGIRDFLDQLSFFRKSEEENRIRFNAQALLFWVPVTAVAGARAIKASRAPYAVNAKPQGNILVEQTGKIRGTTIGGNVNIPLKPISKGLVMRATETARNVRGPMQATTIIKPSGWTKIQVAQNAIYKTSSSINKQMNAQMIKYQKFVGGKMVGETLSLPKSGISTVNILPAFGGRSVLNVYTKKQLGPDLVRQGTSRIKVYDIDKELGNYAITGRIYSSARTKSVSRATPQFDVFGKTTVSKVITKGNSLFEIQNNIISDMIQAGRISVGRSPRTQYSTVISSKNVMGKASASVFDLINQRAVSTISSPVQMTTRSVPVSSILTQTRVGGSLSMRRIGFFQRTFPGKQNPYLLENWGAAGIMESPIGIIRPKTLTTSPISTQKITGLSIPRLRGIQTPSIANILLPRSGPKSFPVTIPPITIPKLSVSNLITGNPGTVPRLNITPLVRSYQTPKLTTESLIEKVTIPKMSYVTKQTQIKTPITRIPEIQIPDLVPPEIPRIMVPNLSVPNIKVPIITGTPWVPNLTGAYSGMKGLRLTKPITYASELSEGLKLLGGWKSVPKRKKTRKKRK